ncbi:NAD-binding protein [candidate division KSB1 bacterium]|nr:NAD-binding protein [candidate division KSB1 bacterium]
MPLDQIAVIGAGVMGTGVAQTLAQTGHKVLLLDRSLNILQRAQEKITRDVRMHQLYTGQKFDPDQILAEIKITTEYGDLAGVDYVMENVTEDWLLKKEVYQQLDIICSQDCCFASDTSAIPITRLASATSRQDKVIGIHFMNPVALKPMVEVIKGVHTSDKTLAITKRILQQMNKKYIVVNDSPGFVSNRVLMLMVNEAIFLVAENIASPQDVDKLFKGCFGHSMGPLETADLIGLDTILNSLLVLYDAFNDSKFKPCPLLKQMVHAGFLGKKSGRGFHTYGGNN